MARCWRSLSARLEVGILASWHGVDHRRRKFVAHGGETLRTKQHGRLPWHCWRSDTLSLQNQEEESFWSGSVWSGLVRMKARAAKVNEIAKELALHGTNWWAFTSGKKTVCLWMRCAGSATTRQCLKDCVMCTRKRCALGDRRIGFVWELWRTQCECG